MTLDDLTNRMIDIAAGNYEVAAPMMLACLQVIPCEIPDVGLSAIEVAKNYWLNHTGTPADLEQARVTCWTYLREQSASTNTDERQYCALRAIIYIMHADYDPLDIVDCTDFFTSVLRGTMKDESEESCVAAVVPIIENVSRRA